MAQLITKNGHFYVEIYRGDDSDVLLDRFRDADGNPMNLSTLYSNVRWQLRKAPEDPQLLLDKSLNDGIQFVADSEGNNNAAMKILIPKEDTIDLLPGKLSADLELTLTDGTVETMKNETGKRRWIVNVIPQTTI